VVGVNREPPPFQHVAEKPDTAECRP
jgi:hypothetical protein